uniref:Uncharacterized protein n=1 Tax=Rhizophora mucronata TaxID=61149 RepID=A0A2P2P5N3_RHIMU
MVFSLIIVIPFQLCLTFLLCTFACAPVHYHPRINLSFTVKIKIFVMLVYRG